MVSRVGETGEYTVNKLVPSSWRFVNNCWSTTLLLFGGKWHRGSRKTPTLAAWGWESCPVRAHIHSLTHKYGFNAHTADPPGICICAAEKHFFFISRKIVHTRQTAERMRYQLAMKLGLCTLFWKGKKTKYDHRFGLVLMCGGLE